MLLRILVFSSMFFGIANFLRALSNSDQEFFWVPLVASGESDEFERRLSLVGDLAEKHVKIHPIYLKAPDNNLKNLLNPKIAISGFTAIFRTLCNLKPDAVLVFFVLDAYPLALLKHLLGYRLIVVAVGGDINRYQHRIHVIVRRMIYSQSDIIIAVSNDLGSKILRESTRSAMIIPTGVDPSFFRKMEPKEALRRKWELPDDAFIILTVSNLETHKGVDVAIRALSLVSQNRADLVKLLVVGTGPQKSKLDQLITDLNLTDRVSFLGELDHWKIRELYSSADLFILSSWNEGLPFALLEAMSCECISLTSPVGDIPRVIEDGRNGFLVNAIRPEEFAEKINMIRSMERHGAESIREQAKRTVVEKFDLATSATRMLEAVERSVE